MELQLVKEANALYDRLNDLMWKYSINRNADNYFRPERISGKALNRWERRYKKWEELQT